MPPMPQSEANDVGGLRAALERTYPQIGGSVSARFRNTAREAFRISMPAPQRKLGN
jgi:hypothetical protein